MAGGAEGDSAVRGSATPGWRLAANSGRCGVSGRAGADDRGGPDGQAAGGNAAHSADDESANLLGPSLDRPELGRANAHNGGSAGERRAALPRLSKAD